MWPELKNLFWLQWMLTRAMFRSRRLGDQLRVVSLLLQIVKFLFTFPMSVLMGIGLAVMLILLSPGAAYEAVMMVNVFMFFIWLVLPASYNSQLIERFEMSRLFPHPISFRSIVVGSTLMAMLTMTGIWTVPILLGEIVGLAWHQPLALPLIALGALPTFALLALTGRIMDDFFDLVAGDRRLRTLVLTLLTLPFIFCWMGQYVTQIATDNFNEVPEFLQIPALEELAPSGEPDSFGELLIVLGGTMEVLRVSRLLTWLPPGWATAGMGLAVRGEWARALLFTAGSTVFAVLLLWAHAGITRRLMDGAALGIGAERVRSRRRWRLHLPGRRWRLSPSLSFWALFRKDWTYLRRSPITQRLIFSSVFMALPMVFPMRAIAESDAAPALIAALPLLAGTFVVTITGMVVNLTLTANYFGAIDREGFATLALSALDRRYVILSENLATVLYTSALWLMLSLGTAVLTGSWMVLLVIPYLGLCLQIGGAPAYNLAAIVFPYRTQLKFTRGRQRGNLWGMLAWLISAPPVLALFVLPYIYWRPGLALTLPLGLVYSVGLYALTLKPLARLLQRREFDILEAVTAQE